MAAGEKSCAAYGRQQPVFAEERAKIETKPNQDRQNTGDEAGGDSERAGVLARAQGKGYRGDAKTDQSVTDLDEEHEAAGQAARETACDVAARFLIRRRREKRFQQNQDGKSEAVPVVLHSKSKAPGIVPQGRG